MLVMNHLPWFNDCLACVGLPETCQLEQQFGAAKVGTSESYVSLIRRLIMSQTFEKASITTELAHRMIAAAEQKAPEIGQPFVIAIVDESGVLKAFSRMDKAPLLSVQVAQDKAYTAIGFGLSTDAWYDFIKDDPPTNRHRSPSGLWGWLAHHH